MTRARTALTVAIATSLAFVLAIPAAPPAPADSRPWRPPVSPVQVVHPYAAPSKPWLPGHRGVDLRARPGQQVHAAGAGTVSFAARLAGRGVVVVDHGLLRTTYEPVTAQVKVGDRVGRGSLIGTVGPGTGHCGTETCLHLGLRRGSQYLNPLLLLTPGRARLRPW